MDDEHHVHLWLSQHQLHVTKRHKVKLIITVGLLVSSGLMLLAPHMQAHAAVLATVTNVYWAWH